MGADFMEDHVPLPIDANQSCGIHYCYDDPEAAKSIVNLAIKALDPKSRARFRTHYGTFPMFKNVGNNHLQKSSDELPHLNKHTLKIEIKSMRINKLIVRIHADFSETKKGVQ